MDPSIIPLVEVINNNYNVQSEFLMQHVMNTNQTDEVYFMALMLFETTVSHYRIEDYCEQWIPLYLEYDFFQLFRMTRDSFDILLSDIHCPEINKVFTGGEVPITGEKMLMMTLWWLGKGEALISVSDKFNVCLSATHRSLEVILMKLVALRNKYITWPNTRELITIERDFHARSGFPGVIGAIDVCNISFKAPADQHESYIDRKLRHSIKLQGICTKNKIFINIMVGFPGSVHDSRVIQNSAIFRDIEHNRNLNKYFPLSEYHLVGDSAYPLLKWLMTPYRNNGNLTERQRRYNTAHSNTRIVIEHTFGLMKSRWRILQYINVNSVTKAVNIIVACCVLHNYCYINNDTWSERYDVEDGDEEIGEHVLGDLANNKRNHIAMLF
ncbi:hypothetical protein MML48_9g00002310 [Holotrichia oblita]|uniref:Uncharacterized protein n=1 Tax=Holotrichia oblita TaxID=644536 RepID=A0ACB9SJJ0_HOLOL|nr:hypothetical protein MML48_9g00002310 [Holotrichia oblita]